MVEGTWPELLVVIGLTVASGIGDAYGFTRAALIWNDGRLVAGELGRSALGFAVGIGLYWLALRYMQALGIVSPEVQTITWFGVTLVGVAALNGKFLKWQAPDQLVGILVLAGIAWLLLRTGS